MRLMIQVLALMMVLMFGIFLGIDTAEQNIHQTQGSQGAPRAVHITPDEEGQMKISVLGYVYETDQALPDQEAEDSEREEREKSNVSASDSDESWLAQAGNETGEGLKKATRKALDQLVALIEESF
ncbi:DUF3679 domain-containing protein [Melghirimyces algeriensis]|uniref:Uncharacterized protein n=1 Tax=Melghirimyces algeriensis TaxID=910412 RepID=A0A521BTS7_9BACL|nr:DUF3679 domain-containing protein [Melghirimyces algeriensis]SMO50559.1 Protein of unknown function [Melghirimyces algeriensis]